MITEDIIVSLPLEIAARLKRDPLLAGLPVVVWEDGNIAATIAARSAVLNMEHGKVGVAVIVLQPVADDANPGLVGGPLLLRTLLLVLEQPEMNSGRSGFGHSSRWVARRCISLLKGCSFGGLVTALRTSAPVLEPATPAPLNGHQGAGGMSLAHQPNWLRIAPLLHGLTEVRACQVNFEALESFGSQPWVAAPAMINHEPAQNVTLACATPGSQIFFSMDNSYPSIAYDGSPITVPAAGIIVRAFASCPGMIDSSISRWFVTSTEITPPTA